MSDPIALCLAGKLSPQVAIAQAVLTGASVEQLRERVRDEDWPRADALRELLDGDLTSLREAAAAYGAHETRSLAGIGAAYDRAVRHSPEAAVAAYSLGRPDLLAQATAEVVVWLREQTRIAGAHVLDLGCGIGRIAQALTSAAHVAGTDVSFAMLREARRRRGSYALLVQTGTALPFRDAAFDLILAVDSFPYIVLAGEAENTMAEITRVLAPPGTIAILNLSYRGLEADRADLARWARRYDLTIQVNGERPFSVWDGAAFILQREG